MKVFDQQEGAKNHGADSLRALLSLILVVSVGESTYQQLKLTQFCMLKYQLYMCLAGISFYIYPSNYSDRSNQVLFLQSKWCSSA